MKLAKTTILEYKTKRQNKVNNNMQLVLYKLGTQVIHMNDLTTECQELVIELLNNSKNQ